MNWLVLLIACIISFTASTSPEMYREARDSQRLSDLGSIKGSLALLLTTVNNPEICPEPNKLYRSDQGTGAVDGTGWIPVNLEKTMGGSPLPYFPKDPTNKNSYVYTYMCDPSRNFYELNSNMESMKYSNAGKQDVESTDGGDDAYLYETGNKPGLTIIHG